MPTRKILHGAKSSSISIPGRVVFSVISYGGGAKTHKQSTRRPLSERSWYNEDGRFQLCVRIMLPVALLQTPKSRLTDTCTPMHASLTGLHPGTSPRHCWAYRWSSSTGMPRARVQQCNPNLTRAVISLEWSYESDIPRLYKMHEGERGQNALPQISR